MQWHVIQPTHSAEVHKQLYVSFRYYEASPDVQLVCILRGTVMPRQYKQRIADIYVGMVAFFTANFPRRKTKTLKLSSLCKLPRVRTIDLNYVCASLCVYLLSLSRASAEYFEDDCYFHSALGPNDGYAYGSTDRKYILHVSDHRRTGTTSDCNAA